MQPYRQMFRSVEQQFPNPSSYQASELGGGFVKTLLLRLTLRVPHSVVVLLCIFSKFPGDAEAAGPGTSLCKPLRESMAVESRVFRGISQTRVQVQILLPLISSVTLGKELTLRSLSFLICKANTITHSSQGYGEDSMRYCIAHAWHLVRELITLSMYPYHGNITGIIIRLYVAFKAISKSFPKTCTK